LFTHIPILSTNTHTHTKGTNVWKKKFTRNLATILGIRTRNVDRRRVFLDHEGSQCQGGSIRWHDNFMMRVPEMTHSPCSFDDEELLQEKRFPRHLGLPKILTVRELLNACASLLVSNSPQITMNETQLLGHDALKTQLGASWLLILGHVQVMSSSSSNTLSLCDRTGVIRVVIPNMASPDCLRDHVVWAFSEFEILAERFAGKTRYSLIVSRSSPSLLLSFEQQKKKKISVADGILYTVIQSVSDGFDVVWHLSTTTSQNIARLYVNLESRLTMQPGQMYFSRRVHRVKGDDVYRLDDDVDDDDEDNKTPTLVRFGGKDTAFDYVYCPHITFQKEDLETQHLFATRLPEASILHVADALKCSKMYSVRGVLVSRSVMHSSRTSLAKYIFSNSFVFF